MTKRDCLKCGGIGLRVVTRPDGNQVAESCECQLERRIVSLHRRMRVPARYEGCTLENFRYDYPGADSSLALAWDQAVRLVSSYPGTTNNYGLVLSGTIGVGKTHLAVGILQTLVLGKGLKGLFCGYGQLAHHSTPGAAIEGGSILRQVLEAEVLVLDELDVARPPVGLIEVITEILEKRIWARRATVITTNQNVLPLAGRHSVVGKPLLDRMGMRIGSLLAENYIIAGMKGLDYRQEVLGAQLLC